MQNLASCKEMAEMVAVLLNNPPPKGAVFLAVYARNPLLIGGGVAPAKLGGDSGAGGRRTLIRCEIFGAI